MKIEGTVKKYRGHASMKANSGWIIYKDLEVSFTNELTRIGSNSYVDVMDYIDEYEDSKK